MNTSKTMNYNTAPIGTRSSLAIIDMSFRRRQNLLAPKHISMEDLFSKTNDIMKAAIEAHRQAVIFTSRIDPKLLDSRNTSSTELDYSSSLTINFPPPVSTCVPTSIEYPTSATTQAPRRISEHLSDFGDDDDDDDDGSDDGVFSGITYDIEPKCNNKRKIETQVATRDIKRLKTTTQKIASDGISRYITPEKPKRALSSYNIFFRHERAAILMANAKNKKKNNTSDPGSNVPINRLPTQTPEQRRSAVQALLESNPFFQDRKTRLHRKSHGAIPFTILVKLISARWKEADSETKTLFESLSLEDKERYSREYDAWCRTQSRIDPIDELDPISLDAGICLSSTTKSSDRGIGMSTSSGEVFLFSEHELSSTQPDLTILPHDMMHRRMSHIMGDSSQDIDSSTSCNAVRGDTKLSDFLPDLDLSQKCPTSRLNEVEVNDNRARCA